MKYFLCESKLNMNIVSILIAVGLNIGLYFNSMFYLISLHFFASNKNNLSKSNYFCVLFIGFICGVLLSYFCSESENKINSFSGINKRIFNYFDYVISIFTGFIISFSFFIINAWVAYNHGSIYNVFSNQNNNFIIRLIFIFGLLHGLYYGILIEGKIFECDRHFNKLEKVFLLIIFMIFFFWINPLFVGYINVFITYSSKEINYLIESINLSKYFL